MQDHNDQILLIVPTLGKRLDLLRFSLQSVLNQFRVPLIVVVAPKSKENDLSGFLCFDNRIIIEYFDGNFSESINFVAKKFSHIKYMNWLGDDDLLFPNSLIQGYEILENNDKCVGVYGGCEYINFSGAKLARYNPVPFSHFIIGFIPTAIKLEGGLFRTAAFNSVGGIPSDVIFAPDVYITLRLRKFGKWQKVPGEPVAKFRLHANSITYQNRLLSIKESQKIQLKYGTVMDKIIVLLFGIIIRYSKYFLFMAINLKNGFKLK